MQPTEHDAGCPVLEDRLDDCACYVTERCWLCEEPWAEDHPMICPEWPKETNENLR